MKDLIETRREPGLICASAYTAGASAHVRGDIPNYDAEVLEELYNGENPGSFRAFIRGKKYADLRFLLNPHGAVPVLPAPEEVALLDFDPGQVTATASGTSRITPPNCTPERPVPRKRNV